MAVLLFYGQEVKRWRFLETINYMLLRILYVHHNTYVKRKNSKMANVTLILVIPLTFNACCCKFNFFFLRFHVLKFSELCRGVLSILKY